MLVGSKISPRCNHADLDGTNLERKPSRDGRAISGLHCPCRPWTDECDISGIDRFSESVDTNDRHHAAPALPCWGHGDHTIVLHDHIARCTYAEAEGGTSDDSADDVDYGWLLVGGGTRSPRSGHWPDTSAGRTGNWTDPSYCLHQDHCAAVGCPSALEGFVMCGASCRCHPATVERSMATRGRAVALSSATRHAGKECGILRMNN